MCGFYCSHKRILVLGEVEKVAMAHFKCDIIGYNASHLDLVPFQKELLMNLSTT